MLSKLFDLEPLLARKIEGTLQELDETAYWLELLQDSSLVAAETVNPILMETNELIAIFTTIVRKVKNR